MIAIRENEKIMVIREHDGNAGKMGGMMAINALMESGDEQVNIR